MPRSVVLLLFPTSALVLFVRNSPGVSVAGSAAFAPSCVSSTSAGSCVTFAAVTLDEPMSSETLSAAAHVANASKTMHRAFGGITTGRLTISL
eukprot:CAMPEP_0181447310 /NCGR_PEP_ID=MMETSP1110-20121109/26554_1 /TAXON_ID=174948 /ORGANISM="Symbiodinium sp., Strain CCMP421" /LENGTH=92 /DNA_ID=CAMNT_0023571415 /DNA_START=345 /DNA_END=620 /DNA_ORIENTATION=-